MEKLKHFLFESNWDNHLNRLFVDVDTKTVNEAVDDVRKAEQKEELQRLIESNLKTGRAYRLKLAMQDL